MEGLSTVEDLNQILESEEASDGLASLPADTYVRLATYAQKLRLTGGSGNDDVSGRLARKQLWLIEVMTKRLLEARLAKVQKEEAASGAGQSQRATKDLLPEERYVSHALDSLARKEERFVRAVADGQPSYFGLVQRKETRRMSTVRISKRMGEIIGADLKRYGPFEVNDVVRLPAANAQAMYSNGQAAPVSTEED